MKVILVNGSSHKNGCTDAALSIVAKELEENGIETKIIWITTKVSGGCIACGKCRESGFCIFNDVVNEVLEEAKTADAFVFGAPVYYASPNGAMISVMDRLFYAGSGSLAFKPAAAVVSARRGGTTASLDVLNKYFTFNQMPVVSSRYWNMVHGSKASDIYEDAEGVQIMRQLGRNMAWLLNCIKLGEQNGVVPNSEEPKVFTNFIR